MLKMTDITIVVCFIYLIIGNVTTLPKFGKSNEVKGTMREDIMSENNVKDRCIAHGKHCIDPSDCCSNNCRWEMYDEEWISTVNPGASEWTAKMGFFCYCKDVAESCMKDSECCSGKCFYDRHWGIKNCHRPWDVEIPGYTGWD